MISQGIPVVGGVMAKLFGTRNERFVRRYSLRVDAINELEPQIRQMTDEQLRGMHGEFRNRHDDGVSEDDLLVEVFAVAREAMDRAVGIRSIFSPLHEGKFDPSRLNEKARELYEQTRREMAALEPRAPEGDLLGNTEPVPAWIWHPIPNELYEAVRELYPESRPPFRSRPFDVQLIGGMVLAGGKIAEMRTGEGKTIVAPLACYLASVQRQQVHVVTVNDYLVQRDRDWTFPYFYALGMTVGAIHPMHSQPEDLKRKMYRCDVVYGTTSEFGFDYLRDNMKRSVEQQVQRQRQFAIVDEVDSILIDEARTPLIISGQAHEARPRYELADGLARHLVDKQRPWEEAEKKVKAVKETIKGLEGDIRQARDKNVVPELQKRLEEEKARLPQLESERDQHTQYYESQPDRKQAHLTHEGIAEAQRAAGVGSFYVGENTDIPHLLEQSVRAHAVYQRDRDYVIMNIPNQQTGRNEPGIVIVDTFTGRPMIGRQWSDGLHQAIEAKEKVPVKDETQTVATVTIQNFFKMYKRLAGMTGTADTEAQEFHDIYGLDVVSIPTNKPVIREDRPDLVYLRARDKWEAIVDEIKTFHDVGRPILVGTTSVEKSELLSQMLSKKHQVKHEVLNAKQHEREANIVENAGALGAVMIATNMAGRGTDIKLQSFTREELLEHWLKRSICSRKLKTDATDEQVREDVFRKVAPQVLDLRKRDAEEMDFQELELSLLRHWATEHTLISEKAIDGMGAEELREALDESGRILIHRIRWYDNAEDMGGLHVIGTERHEARRIDNQLRGRGGRQGDKGSSRFYVSLEDDLMQMFGGETMMKILPRLGLKEGDAIESGMLSKRIEGAQRKVEERNFQVRKNILEYDEVMEHQRQSFYGLRQRVLEGRDVKGLILDFIAESIDDACAKYLDPNYPAECAAEHARQVLDCSILPERLRNKDLDEMETTIRRDAKEDARQMIDVTLGEYIPIEGAEVSVDFDSAGLVNWAKSRFGVELDPAEIRAGGLEERRHVFNTLAEAAAEQIDRADLSGIVEYTERDYGAVQLRDWVKNRFGVEVSIEEIRQAVADEERSANDLLFERAEDVYRQREIAYPVDFAMELTVTLARQGQGEAFDQLATWARRRYGLELDAQKLKTTNPQQVRQQLLDASRRFVEEGRLEKAIEEAMAQPDDESLDAHLKERFGVGITERMRWLEGEEREDAVRARIENILRAELLELERAVLLNTLDQSWKDHLYEMDQLRDAIGFRAFSQQDPRIAFKREGSRLFTEMMSGIRDRVSEQILKARLSPAAMLGQRMMQRGPRPTGMAGPRGATPQPQAPQPGAAPAQPRPAPAAGAAGGMISGPIGGMFAGPGFDQIAGQAPPAGPRATPTPGGAVPDPAAAGGPTPADGAQSTADGQASDDAADPAASRAEQDRQARAAHAADKTKERRR